MNDLQLLREMRSDVGSAPPATLARGRNKLMSKITSDSHPEATTTHAPAAVRPIFRRRVLMASAAAALLVGESLWQTSSGPVREQPPKQPTS